MVSLQENLCDVDDIAATADQVEQKLLYTSIFILADLSWPHTAVN